MELFIIIVKKWIENKFVIEVGWYICRFARLLLYSMYFIGCMVLE